MQKTSPVHAKGIASAWIYQKWFVKFSAADFLLNDVPWLGWLVAFNSDQIKTLLENNQSYTTQEISNLLKISKSSTEILVTLMCHFRINTHTKKKTLLNHISVCYLLLKCNKNLWFLKQVTMSDRK